MRAPSIIITGFPGFLASALIPRLAAGLDAGVRIDCLAESRFESLASERADGLQKQTGRTVRVVVGDITQRGLGLGEKISEVRDTCREISASWLIRATICLGPYTSFCLGKR